MDYVKVLSYGAIGLGCILAIVAAGLLKQELTTAAGKKGNFKPIYAFMTFALFLATLGFVFEHFRGDRSMSVLEAQLKTANDQVADLQTRLTAATNSDRRNVTELQTVRAVLGPLIDTKMGILKRLGEMKPNDTGYYQLVQEMGNDLRDLDSKTQTALNGAAH